MRFPLAPVTAFCAIIVNQTNTPFDGRIRIDILNNTGCSGNCLRSLHDTVDFVFNCISRDFFHTVLLGGLGKILIPGKSKSLLADIIFT